MQNKKPEIITKREFLERVARMYYILDMNQKEIAEQLGIGRSSVGRFLSEAREQGIVQIQIGLNIASSRRTDIEKVLASKFNLKDVVVAKRNLGNSFETIITEYLDSILPFHGSIGLTGGNTLYQTGQYIHQCATRPDLKIVQLSGNSGNTPSASVIQSWSTALNATPVYLHAPAFADDQKSKKVFLDQNIIQEGLQQLQNLDMIIVAIGTSNRDATILQLEIVHDLDAETLKENSVGDISYHFFNQDGDFSMPTISERLIGASQKDITQVPIRIALAYGDDKAPAILGALRGGLVNILLTDEDTAQKIIDLK